MSMYQLMEALLLKIMFFSVYTGSWLVWYGDYDQELLNSHFSTVYQLTFVY